MKYFNVNDLETILDSLNDTLIVQQAAHLTCKDPDKHKKINRRIDQTTRTMAKIMLLLKDAR